MIGASVGHFVITARLGQGGMGEVYRATDRKLGREVAIKLMPADFAQEAQWRQRFLTEAKAASALNHPNVCTVYEVGETDDHRAYIAMEWLKGQTLADRLRQGPLAIGEIVDVAVQVVDALDAAHQEGIVHRDVKPSNIFVNERGQIKVLDFGLAKRLKGESRADMDASTEVATQPGGMLGTPNYMSPEQALGRQLDHRTDLFSLGVVLYEMITGRSAFAGQSLGETLQRLIREQPESMARFHYELPPELDRIVRKCLEKNPEDRYQATRDLLVDLRNLRRDLEQSISPTAKTAKQPVEPQLRNRISDARSGTESNLTKSDGPADVVINYAPVDDQPLEDDRQGWVSQLHRHLSVRIHQLSGESVSISRLPGTVPCRESFPHAKAMLSVVSPPYVKSENCRRMVEAFWNATNAAGTFFIDDRPRLIKVLKTPVAEQEIPAELKDLFTRLMGYEFFELEPGTGRIREFSELFGARYKQRFHERIYDLAHELCQLLRILKQLEKTNSGREGGSAGRRIVYLATATSDVEEDRDRIRRELIERGHVVLPDAPLPTVSADLERVIASYLEQCDLAIHLLGRYYGATPEDSAESIPCLQVRLSARLARGGQLARCMWISGAFQPVDDRQVGFIRRVQEDPELLAEAEVIQGGLNQLKKIVLQKLMPAIAGPEPRLQPAPSKSGPRKVYLVCDRSDEEQIEALEDHLFDRGLDVCLPAFDISPAEADALHRNHLATCDALLVYYGRAPRAWVDIKLGDALKAVGYGRPEPIEIQAVYLAPPFDRRKERYRSHQAHVMHQTESSVLAPELEDFIQAVLTGHR